MELRGGAAADPSPPGAPGAVPAGEVGGPGEAQLAERRRGEARRVALGAHDDDLLVVVPHLGHGVAALQIEAPLEHVALDDDPEPELAFVGSLALGADVDHEGAGGAEPLELVWLDPVDLASAPSARSSSAERAVTERSPTECDGTSRRPVPRSSRPSYAQRSARATRRSPEISKKVMETSAGLYTCRLRACSSDSLVTSCTCPAPKASVVPAPHLVAHQRQPTRVVPPRNRLHQGAGDDVTAPLALAMVVQLHLPPARPRDEPGVEVGRPGHQLPGAILHLEGTRPADGGSQAPSDVAGKHTAAEPLRALS